MPELEQIHCANPSCSKLIRKYEAVAKYLPVGGSTFTSYYCSRRCQRIVERRSRA